MNRTLRLLSAILALTSFVQASAQAPAPKTENGVTYLTGGVGKVESDALNSEAKNYPLALVFAAGKRNAYLANVNVTIKDGKGKTVLRAVADGPILLAKLPPGQLLGRGAKGEQQPLGEDGRGKRKAAFAARFPLV